MRRFFSSLMALTCVAFAGGAAAQMPASEHAAHHGGPASPATMGGQPVMSPPPAAAAPPGGMGGEMGEMMKQMGRPPRQELYPSLINLPALTPEDREQMQRLAHERMQGGLALLSGAFDAVSKAANSGDYAAMQAATAELRQGLEQLEDGVQAHRALTEGRQPGGIALNWFRQNLNLEQPLPRRVRTVLGLSPMHVIVMALLAGFAAVMIAMYFSKMRRASAILARLTTAGPVGGAPAPATPPATPPVSGPGPPPAGAPPAAARASARWAGTLRVARIVQETPNVKTFRLVAAGGGPVPFAFLPGQFLNLALTIDGQLVRRSFTIASSPSERQSLDLTIKREEHGLVSRFMHDRIRQGASLQVNAPFGTFTFTGQEADSIVLIGAGVGVTPLMSVTRYLVGIGWTGDIFLLYGARTTADIIFRDEIELLARRSPNLRVTITLSKPDAAWTGPTGRLSKGTIAAAVPEISRRRAHICGPQAMMDATRQSLVDLGVAATQIKMEDFGPAAPRPAPAPVLVPALPVVAAPGPQVRFRRSQKSTSIAGRTVLEASEAIGVEIPWSCRVGTCGVCKSYLVSGQVTMAVEDGLDPGEKDRGMILACQARATADVVVEA